MTEFTRRIFKWKHIGMAPIKICSLYLVLTCYLSVCIFVCLRVFVNRIMNKSLISIYSFFLFNQSVSKWLIHKLNCLYFVTNCFIHTFCYSPPLKHGDVFIWDWNVTVQIHNQRHIYTRSTPQYCHHNTKHYYFHQGSLRNLNTAKGMRTWYHFPLLTYLGRVLCFRGL